MNIYDFIKNGGTKEVSNPNYNPKSKKNTEPPTIKVPDLNPTIDRAVNMAIMDFNNQYSIDSKDAKKYRDYGINYNPLENLDVQLADAQSAWKKWGNSLAQTLVSELALGTVKAGSDLFDFVGQSIGLSSPDYTNPVSEVLEQWQEQFRQFAPVYADPNKNILNGGLIDAGWWASNMPSIVSSLTLLVPGMAITKAAKLAGIGKLVSNGKRYLKPVQKAVEKAKTAEKMREAGKTAEEIKKATQLTFTEKLLTNPKYTVAANVFAENTTTAALSRTMENYQEARQTYNDMYVQASEAFNSMNDEEYQNVINKNKDFLQHVGIDTQNKDEVAKAIAKKAADETFKLDYLNTVFDVIQLYALRGLFKGKPVNNEFSSSVRRAQLDAEKYAGKTAQEIAEIKSKLPFRTRAKEWLGDKFYSGKLVLTAEASEGVEEAVNYIAQQEGIHLGSIMLGQLEGEHDTNIITNALSGFDGRIKDYAAAPALWDAAFWGVLGGIVFQGLGSKARQIEQKLLDDSKLDKEEKKKLPWYRFEELPENKAKISEIQNRSLKAQEYIAKLDKINQNIDIVNSNENETVYFGSAAEQDLAREQLQKEYISSMGLDAMHVGTMDLLKSYFSNDNVRKSMIEAGFFNEKDSNGNQVQKTESELESESKEFIQNSLNQLEQIENLYNEELVAINDIIGIINNDRKTDNQIPVEYIQIIADRNVRNRLARETVDRTIAGINQSIDDIRSKINDELDPAIDYERNIRIKALTETLSDLRAQRKQLINIKNNKETNTDPLSIAISINNIDKQITYIEKQLRTDYGQATLFYATYESLLHSYDDKGNLVYGPTPEAIEYYDRLITNRVENGEGKPINLSDIIGDNVLGEGTNIVLDNAQVGEYNTLHNDIENSIKQLDNVSKELTSLYYTKTVQDLIRQNLTNNITRNRDSVEDYVNSLRDTFNTARHKAVMGSFDILRKIYKDKKQDLLDAVELIVNGKSIDGIKNLTDSEKAKIKDAIDILAVNNHHKKKDFVNDIFNSIALIDAQETAREKNNPNNNNSSTDNNNESQENTTQILTDSATIDQQLNNSTTQPIEPLQQAPTQSQSQLQSQINPQNINRPVSYTQSANSIQGVLVNENAQISFYQNDDGTFTIDTSKYPVLFKNQALYENADSIDVLSGNPVVEKYPILKPSTNGKAYDVVEKGIVRIENNGTNPANTTEVVAAPNNPSTGESVNLISNDESQNVSNEGITNVKLDDLSKLNILTSRTIMPLFRTLVVNNVIPDLDAAEKTIRETNEKLINDAVLNGISRSDAEQIVNKATSVIFRKINQLRNNSTNTMSSSVDELIIAQDFLNNSNTVEHKDAVSLYKQSMHQMLNQYVAELGIQEVNGKSYIVLEDLLRYVNKVTNDSTTATNIFDALKNYILTTETKEKFVVVDENDINKLDFWDNVAKSREQRLKEREQESTTQSVNIEKVLNNARTEEEREEVYQALEKLKPGDKLTIEVSHKDHLIYIKDEKGNKVGSITIPNINHQNGNYEITNDGWIYSISVDNQGNINSPIYDFFLNIFSGKTDASKEILSIVYENAFGKPSEERYKELLKSFENNIEIVNAKKNGATAKNASNAVLLEGLTKLIAYSKDTIGQDIFAKDNIRSIRLSLNNWFYKLNESYDIATDIANNPNSKYEFEVKSIGIGEIIRVHERVSPENVNNLPVPSNSIAGGINTSVNKISITHPINANTLLISGAEDESFRAPKGSTFVTVPDGFGTNQYVQAYPVNATDESLGKETKEIINTIREEAYNLFIEYDKNPSIENRNKLEQFFSTLLSMTNGNSTLFRNVSIAKLKDNKGFKINATGKADVIFIYNSSYSQEDGIKVGIGEGKYIGMRSKEFKDKLNTILDNLKFQFSYAYFTSDSNTNTHLNGIATRKNGKFIITIGEKSWEFDSFNDFVLNQNIVRLNTKPNEQGTSNFSRKFERNSNVVPSFKINVTRQTSSPVKESTTSTKTTIPSNAPVTEKVRNILNSDIENKAEAIVESIIGTNSIFTNDMLTAFKNLNLLPKNLIFDEAFNNQESYDGINAEYNPRTGQITIGTKWLEMFDNPDTRSQAIRKLIHEQIHALIRQQGKNASNVIKSIENIYNEFKDALNNKEVINKLEEAGLNVKHLKVYLFNDKNNNLESLEEFLVESLTSAELATALNNIEVKGIRRRKSTNLFKELFKILADLFGWGINKRSLYEKELETIRVNFSKPKTEVVEENIQQEEAQQSEEKTEEHRTIIPQPQEENKDKEFGEIKKRDRNRPKSRLSSVDEQINNYTKEMISIKEKAIANGTFMKAPNGNPTNLNERQWLQVRTSNFINWFGDWINNPSEASKVVDENGEPLVVYHRSDSPIFFTFDISKAKKESNVLAFAYHFGTEKAADEVDLYGSDISSKYAIFLNIKNEFKWTDVEQGDFTRALKSLKNNDIISDEEFGIFRDYRYDKTPKERLELMKNLFKRINKDGYSYINNVEDRGNKSWAVFNPNQIKSADFNNGDFSTINDDIRYSSVTEMAVNIPSVESFTDRLPIAQQAKFFSFVAHGEVSSSCK